MYRRGVVDIIELYWEADETYCDSIRVYKKQKKKMKLIKSACADFRPTSFALTNRSNQDERNGKEAERNGPVSYHVHTVYTVELV